LVKKDEIDWQKATEMEQRLNQLEQEKRERTKVFNPKELVRKAREVRELYDEDLGTVRYVLLSYSELSKIIDEYKDNRDRSIALLYGQLAPANEGLTFEDVKAMPYEVVVRLLTKLQTDGSFFSKKKAPFLNGSVSTGPPSQSGS
jgi:hypothetical protein